MLEVREISKPRTLLQWYEEQDRIDMSPSYQRRGDLWPERNKKLLINSILNRYDVPKIYLADFTYASTDLNENKKPYAVIDGKQRLSIFFAFLNDKLSLDDTPVYQDENELTLSGLHYSDLTEEYPTLAQRFENFVPTVMSVMADKLEEVQELFIRLNQNVSISGPERRNAMRGPLPGFIRNLSVHEFFRNYAAFPIDRGQDLNLAAKILFMEERGGFVNTKKEDLDQFVKANEDSEPSRFEPTYQNAVRNLDRMTQVFEESDLLLKRQAQLTIYYRLVGDYADQYPDRIRSFLIEFERQRKEVRAQADARARGKSIEISDPTLLEYNGFVRSPDDKSRQENMFRTLKSRFKDYLSTTLT